MLRWIGWSVLLAVIACRREPRPTCNPPCQNGAPCLAGQCQCPMPLEGPACEKDARDKFLYPWEGRRRCESVRSGLRYAVWKEPGTAFLFLGGSFYGTGFDTLKAVLVDPWSFIVDDQSLVSTPALISGKGETRRDSLFLTVRVQLGIGRAETCFFELKRR
ncbi:MAG: hypothetical protein NZ580_02005 [Bacteroidia bacterium]|nr:hypothetical protein [Bacteroidia bacterium]MDW8235745.1 hypothetical protein [Bacteroidia bacterium]